MTNDVSMNRCTSVIVSHWLSRIGLVGKITPAKYAESSEMMLESIHGCNSIRDGRLCCIGCVCGSLNGSGCRGCIGSGCGSVIPLHVIGSIFGKFMFLYFTVVVGCRLYSSVSLLCQCFYPQLRYNQTYLHYLYTFFSGCWLVVGCLLLS